VVPPALRGLKIGVNLRWLDFTLVDDSRSVVVGRRSFHAAIWNEHGVTLSLAADQCLQNTIPSRSCFTLCPVTEFSDLVPAHYLPGQPNDKMDLVQGMSFIIQKKEFRKLCLWSYSSILYIHARAPTPPHMHARTHAHAHTRAHRERERESHCITKFWLFYFLSNGVPICYNYKTTPEFYVIAMCVHAYTKIVCNKNCNSVYCLISNAILHV
jgi:hypothetical protein